METFFELKLKGDTHSHIQAINLPPLVPYRKQS